MNYLPAGFPDGAPPDILACLEGARIEDRSSSPCARVFFLESAADIPENTAAAVPDDGFPILKSITPNGC